MDGNPTDFATTLVRATDAYFTWVGPYYPWPAYFVLFDAQGRRAAQVSFPVDIRDWQPDVPFNTTAALKRPYLPPDSTRLPLVS